VTGRRQNGTGRVRQLKSRRWQARYTGPDGVTRPAPHTFDSKLDADSWLTSQEADVRLGLWSAPEPEALPTGRGVTVREYAEAWLAARDLKPTTRQHYRGLLDRFIIPTLGTVPMDRLTAPTVRTWYATLDASRPTLRSHTYALLRTLCRAAIDDGVMSANPCTIRGAGGSPKPKHRTRPATVAELDALAAAMPERYRAMVVLAGWCGLRFGEVAELRRVDVDVKRQTVSVRRGVTRVRGELIVGTPKSEAGDRVVSVPPHVVPMLADHLNQHTGKAPDSLLFPAANGGHLSPSALYWHFHKARDTAGRPDLRFHDLRHTAATLAAVTGATTAELMARLGHSTSAAAMRYQHAAADRDAAIAAALSGLAADNVVSLTGRRRKDSAASR